MSITVQVQLGWFKRAVINSVKYQAHETNTVSPGLFLVLLWLWYSNTVHCKFSRASLYKAGAWWVPCRHSQCSLWMGCPSLCVLGEARFVVLSLGGAILKDFASKIRVGSVTCCAMELSAVRLSSPRLVHDVTSVWGFPSLLKSMSPSPAVQAGLKAATCSH